jgi:hypothetical protein
MRRRPGRPMRIFSHKVLRADAVDSSRPRAREAARHCSCASP